MPAGDGTGPQGAGPMTGRGLGDCTEQNANGVRTAARPRRYMAYRRGRGNRNRARGSGRNLS